MSEYQYYEFTAIDRPLTRAEMAELRAVSTRADITPTCFRNHYEWGDLKADPADWMRRYFDGFVYVANWCSCRLVLRLPRSTFSKTELKVFVAQSSLVIDAIDDYWIITWLLDESEDYDRFTMDDGNGWMRRLAPLRDELLRGDLRPLYLGWLAAASLDALQDDMLEPAPPPALADLSPAQQSLVEFLEIAPDMLTAAAAGSPTSPDGDAGLQDDDLDAWLEQWPRHEMVAVLKLMAEGQGQVAERQVRSRHAAWLKAQRPQASPNSILRSVAELREAAAAASVIRLERESRERAAQEAEQRSLREAQLRQLMTNAKVQWAAADAQAQRGSASGYDRAVRILAELAEGYALTATRKAFDLELRRLLARHATRGALLRRLSEAGLWSR
jgi:hypothetical protein